MNRRRYLAAAGATAGLAVAGCLGDGTVDGYETTPVDGQSVPLVPTDEAYEWYEAGDTHYVDARSRSEYDRVHIEGAVLSPAPDGLATDDPTEGWDADQRIVTYCVCPHLQAGQRAASLMADGYTEVYALDEGLQEWIDRGHPVAGYGVQQSLPAYEVRGRSDPAHAGENVWIREPTTGQREGGPVGADGGYELTLHFVDLTADTVLELEAPDYELSAPLETLTSTVITGPDAVA